jgi:hypothetical protein
VTQAEVKKGSEGRNEAKKAEKEKRKKKEKER